ncbi:MAG: site-specific integrase [Bacteroidota bacterium]
MFTLNEFLTFEHENEHVLEHDLEHTMVEKRKFSKPKIYNAKGDLTKRWYVYFSFRNPETGKLQRMKNIYGKANNYKTKEGRLYVLSKYSRRLFKLLKEGYNPFEDNTALFLKNREQVRKDKVDKPTPPVVIEKKEVETKKKETTKEKEEPKLTIKEAFDFSLKLKEKQLSDKSLQDYKYHTNALLNWLKVQHPKVKTIDQLDKKLVLQFLNYILQKTSPRNRNNYRTSLSSVIQTLEENEVISVNFVKKIKVLKSIPVRNKTYTLQKQEEIFTYLKKEDPILLLFIKFVAYNFLRPIEVCRLRIKDIDLENKIIHFKAKNKPLKKKIIPQILIDDLPDLSSLNKEYPLFTPDKIGGVWDTAENNRRDYFSKRFKTVVKEHFNLGKEYGMYSFRHTFITKLYRELVKDSSPNEAKSKLMQITGHSTMSALEKYLRDIDAELPDDYSKYLK